MFGIVHYTRHAPCFQMRIVSYVHIEVT